MFKTRQKLLNVSLLLTTVMLLSACGGGGHIIPIKKGIKGNSKLVSVSVTSTQSLNSTQIAQRVKTAITKKAATNLKGSQAVKLKVSINNWQPSFDRNGNKTINTGYRLNGVISVLDANSGAIIGKYNIASIQRRSDKTFAVENMNQKTIDNFAYFTVYELE